MEKVLDLAKQLVEVLGKSELARPDQLRALAIVKELMERDKVADFYASSPEAVARLIGEINKAVRDGAVLRLGP